MQTEILKQLDDLSPESREKLSKQIRRVQFEARNLRTATRLLRRAQSDESAPRTEARRAQTKRSELPRGVFQQMTRFFSIRGRRMLKGTGSLASAGTSMAGSASQVALSRGGDLGQVLSQRKGRVTRSMANWRSAKTSNLRKQRRYLMRAPSDWRDNLAHQLRKLGRNIGYSISDQVEEAMYQLRKQGRTLAQKLSDQKEDAAHQLRKQSRHMARGLSDRKVDMAYQLRKQKQSLVRSLQDDTEDISRRMRSQSQQLMERGNQFVRRQRQNRLWSVLGFLAGFLLAGGITVWLIRRSLSQQVEEEEEQIELSAKDSLDGFSLRPGSEVRYASQGGTAVATRPDVESASRIEPSDRVEPGYRLEQPPGAGAPTRFVGVLSTRRYYPIEQKPVDVVDLVFFTTEAEARAEGYTAAP